MNKDFQQRLHKYLNDCDRDESHLSNIDLLENYIQMFTGGQFESYGTNDPFSFSSDDLVAVMMLSMEMKNSTKSGISPRSALKIAENSKDLSSILRELSSSNHPDAEETSIEEMSSFEAQRLLLDKSSPAQQLVRKLLELLSDSEKSPNIKWVAVSKLISRKRPSLLPIRDGRVAQRLGHARNPTSDRYLAEWWKDWHEALTSDQNFPIRDRLEMIRHELKKNGRVEFCPSLIRIADVLVWSRCQCGD
jgi:hypothetical protein